ncbi:hypothetical protein TVAG_451190 [Trichomonas vaginalis G3]|uniref:Cell cycle control protein 50A n=1 Tax=Trichomonas vaginalis (strain ATCC PRA-98 / G3) TaxID=412133 RepID=A2EYS1_TRIV3|nr:aminophospholipid transmembrane transporter protein [Trichomonas vaginalis G3]EAY02218.1 hypothetical protein TVAG_451190 [Trichomonas vaginalis G3]KAI5501022.1 aminophospholipid transmembrane transporter protein [Trichomonas vaginalis G3]|eukprot:XP_001314556.1 hypothetical protein [Trichomonas vaginalis G3]
MSTLDVTKPTGRKQRQTILLSLKEWHAFITPRTAVIVLYVIGLLFIGLGTTFFIITGNMTDIEIRYDRECYNKSQCIVWFNTTSEISGKISMEYKLYGLYQNHRRIFDSRSYPQMQGKFLTYSELIACDPIISVNKSKEVKDLYAPCGLMSLSFFNDTYIWNYADIANFTSDDIALASDRKRLFKGLNIGYNKSVQWLDNYDDFPGNITNQHFIVWMRAAAMPVFLKLYSKCYNCTIPPGNYSILIKKNYPESMFDGQRSIVFSTTSSLGSGSYFISTAYMSMGGVSLVFATAFLFHMLFCPRQFGDLSQIWSPQAQTQAPLMSTTQENSSDESDYQSSVHDGTPY